MPLIKQILYLFVADAVVHYCSDASSAYNTLIQEYCPLTAYNEMPPQKLPSVEGNFLTPVTQEQLTSNDTWIRTYKCPATLPQVRATLKGHFTTRTTPGLS